MSTEPASTERFVRDLTENARRIYGYIFALVPNWADADEIFQETSAELWTKYGDYRPGTDFRAWAFRFAYYKVLQFRKAEGKNVLRLSDRFIDAIDRDALAGGDLWKQRHQLLADCYALLRLQDRELLDLRYEPGATTKSVAAAGRPVARRGLQGAEPHPRAAPGVHRIEVGGRAMNPTSDEKGDRSNLPERPAAKRGQVQFAGTARRVLRTNWTCPLFRRLSPSRPPRALRPAGTTAGRGA